MAVNEGNIIRASRRIKSIDASPRKTAASISSAAAELLASPSETPLRKESTFYVQASIALDMAARAKAGLQAIPAGP